MNVLAVIPARWASTRLEGKVLIDICGKPLIQHVWEQVSKCANVNEVIVAVDEQHVLDAVEKFGAKAVLTDKNHVSGSDRVAEVAKNSDEQIIINVQGDEPLIQPQLIDSLAQELINDESVQMATVVKGIENEEDLDNPNVVKVVRDEHNNALYFSRSKIPFDREGSNKEYLKHIGIYAYRKEFLLKFTQLPKTKLEETEKLEQLRVLEAGYTIKTVLTDVETIGVDTPEDVKKVEEAIANA